MRVEGYANFYHDLDKLVIAQKFVSQFITSYHNSSIFLTFSLSNPSTPPEKWACGDSCKFLLRFEIWKEEMKSSSWQARTCYTKSYPDSLNMEAVTLTSTLDVIYWENYKKRYLRFVPIVIIDTNDIL